MKAIIAKKEEIAAGTLYVELSVNEEVKFAAGQFFALTLLNPPYTDNRGNRRFFGFVNSPTQNKSVVTVTRTGPSAFKRSLQEAAIGTEVGISEISGNMTLPDDPAVPLVVVTGGIGITPYMSMFSYIKEKNLLHKITLIYANTSQESAIYLKELEEYAKGNPNFKLVAVLTGGKGLSEETLKNNPGPDGAMYFISGTPRFVPAMVKMLKGLGVAQTQLRWEIFTGY